MIKRIKTRIENCGFFLNGMWQRKNIELLFASTIKVDRSSKLSFGSGTRIFGKILAINTSNIQVGNNVSTHKTSIISVSDGGTVIIGNSCSLAQNVILNASGSNQIVLGEDTTFYGNVLISGAVQVGKGVLFANNINVLSSTHCINGRKPIRELDKEYIKEHGSLPTYPISIGDNCWIGLNAVILPGTKIGHGCVVAAGAIVRGEFPDFSIIGGVPAKIIGTRTGE